MVSSHMTPPNMADHPAGLDTTQKEVKNKPLARYICVVFGLNPAAFIVAGLHHGKRREKRVGHDKNHVWDITKITCGT